MDITVFIIAFIALTLLYLFLGAKYSKGMNDSNDFYLASRKLGLGAMCMTMVATQLGGGALLGTSNQAYVSGLTGILYNLGMCLGFVILGFGLAKKWRKLEVMTVSDIYTKSYDSTGLKKTAGLLSALSLFGGLVAQVVASKSILLGLGMDNQIVFLGFWLIVIVYTMLGGLKAVVVTDKIQVQIIFVSFVALFIYLVTQVDFSQTLNFVSTASNFPQAENELDYTSLFLLPVMFSLIQQDLAQRVFSTKDENTARNGAVLAGIVLLIFSFIPVFLGSMARYLNLEVPQGASALVVVLGQYLSPVMMALIMCAILAAVISTADSLICAISSNLDHDLELGKKLPVSEVGFSRITTIFVGVLALILGNYFSNILGVLLKSYELPVAAMFVTVMVALFSKNVSKLGAKMSVLSGLISFIVMNFVTVSAIPSVIVCCLISMAFYILGAVVENKQPVTLSV